QIGRELAGKVGVRLGAHRAAAAPGLVADAPEGHVPRLVAAVLAAQIGHRRVVAAGDILDPFAHLAHGSGPDIAADVRIRAQHLAELEELVRAERVALDDVAPVRVDHARPLGGIADAVAPVILVGEAPAGPTQVGDPDAPQRLDDVGADAIPVGDRGILADPEATVDAPAEMLGEVAIEVAADRGAGGIEIDDDASGHGVLISGSALSASLPEEARDWQR